MIDYSVAGRLSNPGDKDSEKKYYAQIQQKELVSTDTLIEHVSDHNGSFTVGTITGVLADTSHCVAEFLLEGKKVVINGLGAIFMTLQSKATATAAEFTAANITGITITFSPDQTLVDKLRKAKFNVVASRAAQAATLKAEKAGETTVDISKKTTSAPDDPEDGNNDGGSSGGGSDIGGNTGGGSSSGNEDSIG